MFLSSQRWPSQMVLQVKEPACQYRRHKRCAFNPWVRKIPWRREGNPLQYSCLENPMDRGASRATYRPWGHRVRHDWSDLARTHIFPEAGPYCTWLNFRFEFHLFQRKMCCRNIWTCWSFWFLELLWCILLKNKKHLAKLPLEKNI